jgi:hypothetical protein
MTREQYPATIDNIRRMVGEYFTFRMVDMSSKRCPHPVALPQQIAMYLCRKLTRASLAEIANAFGKTHATVVHACATIEKRIQADSAMRDTVHELASRLTHPPFGNRSKHDLVDIAQHGAGIALNVSDAGFDKHELKDIAKAVQDGCALELRGLSAFDNCDLCDIADAAPGRVKFVF